MSSMSETTQLVMRLGKGDSSVSEKLLPLVYEELRELAARHFQHERLDHTLQPTALVHEAYMRLVETDGVDWRSKAQFIALASKQIRKILVDHARKHRAAKRGGDSRKIPLDEAELEVQNGDLDLVALDEALSDLAERSERQSQVVELRFFGGMSVEEAARVLKVSPGTVKGDWRTARAWLQQHLQR